MNSQFIYFRGEFSISTTKLLDQVYTDKKKQHKV